MAHHHPHHRLTRIGSRQNVLQIVPTKHDVLINATEREPRAARETQDTAGLASPTGPGGAPGFHNVAGSQIATPHVTNVYCGPFWGDTATLEAFSKAVVENGYLDPLQELNYGTGSGTYLGPVQGPTLSSGTTLTDADAQQLVRDLITSGAVQADANSLFGLILPNGVTSQLDAQDSSCAQYCGYHDAFTLNGVDVAYMVLPSSQCQACGGDFTDFTAVYAHELAEASTDKVPGQGWVAADGEENGDLEAWVFLPYGPPDNPSLYTVQGYYTNERGNTIGAWRT